MGLASLALLGRVLKKRNRGSRFRIRIRFPDTKTPNSIFWKTDTKTQQIFFWENGYENEYVKNEQENEVGNVYAICRFFQNPASIARYWQFIIMVSNDCCLYPHRLKT